MTTRNLDYLLRPRSVAVIGASRRPNRIGTQVFDNVLRGGFKGHVYAVNPKYTSLDGHPVHASVMDLPAAPDLAVICTPPATVPVLIDALGRIGCRAAVVLTTGLGRPDDARSRTLLQAALDAARPYLLRVLGPGGVGLLVPALGLNASFARGQARHGKLAFVSQSGALTAAVLDWANANGIGFSYCVSTGDGADVDFGDMLDELASDAGTRAILLYIEAIRDARKFMSAARAAARNKPVVVVKAGRVPEGARAAASHAGALVGGDEVYDAAIRRAGMLRVNTTEDLFGAVETLTHLKPMRGDALGIITNGGGPGVMATDTLVAGGCELAALAQATVNRLDALLPPTLPRDNPLDIGGDATPERYANALDALLHDARTSAALLIHAPTALVDSEAVAEAIAPLAASATKNVFACWLGGASAQAARRRSREAGFVTFYTPERAVQAFLKAVEYRRNQSMLMETPPSIPASFAPDVAAARTVIERVMADGRDALTELEAKAVLAAYQIPVVETRVARSPDEAASLAQAIGFPVALKLLSFDVMHKSDVGGVVLDIETPAQAREAAERIAERAREARVAVGGFSVQRMLRNPDAFELIVGAATDPVFGPVILFGQGGTAVEVIADRAIGLPPLNLNLARELVSRARVAKLLAGYRNRPAADHEAIYLTLAKVSQLVCDIAEVVEFDINPLLADASGVLALDARIVVRAPSRPGHARLAIRPYPQELETPLAVRGNHFHLRPIRPEDEAAYNDFFLSLTPEDVHFRFFRLIRSMPHSELARMTQIDYDREMAFVATAPGDVDAQGMPRLLGVVQAHADPANEHAEFAIAIRPDQQHKGLGRALMAQIVAYCRQRGTGEVYGEVLSDNTRMLALAKAIGFRVVASEDGVTRVALPLRDDSKGAHRPTTTR